MEDIHDKLEEINVTLGKQQVILENHIHRTELLEGQFEEHKKSVYRIEGGIKLLFAALTFIEVISKFIK